MNFTRTTLEFHMNLICTSHEVLMNFELNMNYYMMLLCAFHMITYVIYMNFNMKFNLISYKFYVNLILTCHEFHNKFVDNQDMKFTWNVYEHM